MNSIVSRISRKLILILAGVTVLGGGSGAAAVYIGADTILGPSYKDVNGLSCTTIETIRIKKADRYWIRKYVTTDKPGDGVSRLKTALRVARAVHQAERSDLVQVTVLDAAGPTERSAMRGRAIGAQVVYVPDPSSIQHPARVDPNRAYYVDGAANASGEFWGLRIELPLEDAEAMSAALTDDADCAETVVEGADDSHGGASGPGEAKHETPEGEHREEAAGSHGTSGGGQADKMPVAEHETDSQPGLLASLMGVVGLGGETAEAAHGAPDAAGHDLPPDHHVEPNRDASSSSHETGQDHASADQSGEPAEPAPAARKGWFDSVKGMIGLDDDIAVVEKSSGEPAADAADMSEKAKHPDTADVTTDGGEAGVASPASDDDHGAAWLARMRAKPLTPEAAGTAGSAKAQGGTTVGAKSQETMVAEDDDPEKHRKKPVSEKTP